ncbi:MAG: peptidylprolyl isomerase [Deltaproteobacteria bacterium]|nr:peptidylprolyl isomerase [Deltaproteobacteria bacterium]
MFMTCFFLFAGIAFAGSTVEMKTSVGMIQIELNAEKAPETVRNFLNYVDRKYYDGTIFHRVIKGFMIQGGGFDDNEQRKETLAPIKNEANNGLKNIKGSIAMARTGVVDSATSQFFINLADNDFLNHRGSSAKTYGYAVFGQVKAGMDVVEKIGQIKTVAKSPVFRDFPEPKVTIESIRRVE